MNFFDKEPSKHNPSDFMLTLSLRQISLVSAGIVLVCLFTFMAGYFLGKKNAAEQFLYKIEQESLADQIYSSMCGLSDKDENADDADAETESSDAEHDGVPSEAEAKVSEEAPAAAAVEPVNESKFYAQLAGFGSHDAAKKCMQKLEKRGFKVELVERKSKTAKGKLVSWYQIVTKKFDNKADLLKIVQSIKKLEHLSGVQIVSA